jgi:hypothetical protein
MGGERRQVVIGSLTLEVNNGVIKILNSDICFLLQSFCTMASVANQRQNFGWPESDLDGPGHS